MTHPGLAVMLMVGVGLGAVLYYFFATESQHSQHEIPQGNRRPRNRTDSNRPCWPPGEARNRRPGSTDCTICMEETEKENGVRLVSCMHVFHKQCIETWRANGAGNVSCCPVCRDKIMGFEQL